jgi:hypothetical protein
MNMLRQILAYRARQRYLRGYDYAANALRNGTKTVDDLQSDERRIDYNEFDCGVDDAIRDAALLAVA